MQVQPLGVDEGPRLRSIRLRALRDAPTREIAVDPASAERIVQERDEARLETWIRRALKATRLADVFDED